MRVVHSRHLDRGIGFLFPRSLCFQTYWISRRVVLFVGLERSLLRVLILWELLTVMVCYIHFYPVDDDNHPLHYHLYKAQVTEYSRWTIGQRRTTTAAKGAKCVKDGHCYWVSVCSMLAALCYILASPTLFCIGHMVLWLPILSLCCSFYGSHKLCYESLHHSVSFLVEIIV